ncbi:hypothetical protein LTR17_020660 [Elasticomyces elasticus]|nr:hypothetical protein LTR17_020660 [Elasticomyces elasticus]
MMDSEVGKKCHLLALPPELRNRIYECVFEDEAPRNIHVGDIDNHWPSAALPASCQQICKETLEMLRAAVLRFQNDHVCIIDMEPLISNEKTRTMLRQRFGGTGYSSAKLQSFALRIGNAEVQSTLLIMSDGVITMEAPTYTGSVENLDQDTLGDQERDLFMLSDILHRRLPYLTAGRWGEHCCERDIPVRHMHYEDARTWDIKDIVQETCKYCSDKAMT